MEKTAGKFRVLFDFEAVEEGEMSVLTDEIVIQSAGADGLFGTADDTREGDDGWILVERTAGPGESGFVPLNYLEPLSEAAVPQNEQAPLVTAPEVVDETEAPPPPQMVGAGYAQSPPSPQVLPGMMAPTSISPNERAASPGGHANPEMTQGRSNSPHRRLSDSSPLAYEPIANPSTKLSPTRLQALEISSKTSNLLNGDGPLSEAGQLLLRSADSSRTGSPTNRRSVTPQSRSGRGSTSASGGHSPSPSGRRSPSPSGERRKPVASSGRYTPTPGQVPSLPGTLSYSSQKTRPLGEESEHPSELRPNANPRRAANQTTPIRRFSDARLARSLKSISGKPTLTPERGELPQSLREPETTDPISAIMAKNATPLSTIKNKGLLGDSKGRSEAPGSVLRAAVKGVQNANFLAHQAAPIKPPSLSAAVASGDFSLLLEKNEEFFTDLTAARTESFASMMQLQENINTKIEAVHQQSEDLVSQIVDLENLIDQERRSWKYMVHDDTETELMSHISKNPISTPARNRTGQSSFLSGTTPKEQLLSQITLSSLNKQQETGSVYSGQFEDDRMSKGSRN